MFEIPEDGSPMLLKKQGYGGIELDIAEADGLLRVLREAFARWKANGALDDDDKTDETELPYE